MLWSLQTGFGFVQVHVQVHVRRRSFVKRARQIVLLLKIAGPEHHGSGELNSHYRLRLRADLIAPSRESKFVASCLDINWISSRCLLVVDLLQHGRQKKRRRGGTHRCKSFNC